MRKKSHDPGTQHDDRPVKDHQGEEPWTDEDEAARDQYMKETSDGRGRSVESEDKE